MLVVNRALLKISSLMLPYLVSYNVSCSKGNFQSAQNIQDKKVNPYSGSDTETKPSEISGAWLVMCRSAKVSDGSYMLQCRVGDKGGDKYQNKLQVKIGLPDGLSLDPMLIKNLPTSDYFTFEAMIKSPGPVAIEVSTSDGVLISQKKVPLSVTQDLGGLLVGVCGYNAVNGPMGCTQFRAGFFVDNPQNVCPTGYLWRPMASRFQGAGGIADPSNSSGTCVLSEASVDPSLLTEMNKTPADYAVKGAAYGFSFNTDGRCDIATNIFPMDKTQCTCPNGFEKKEISAHVQSSTTGRSYTCVALATGPKAAPLQKFALTELQSYQSIDHQKDMARCLNGSWAPISARADGLDNRWRSVCLSE